MSKLTLEWAKNSPYGFADFSPDVPEGYKTLDRLRDSEIKCCIRGCRQWLRKRRAGDLKAVVLFCPDHGISLSSAPTYIYRDYHRNFMIATDLIDQVTKVEKWRLGNESSDDALSWNVFVGLLKLGALSEPFHLFTDMKARAEPELYLWGNRIRLNEMSSFSEELKQARANLEARAGLPTEPDIMLRVPGQAMVLIEAKFGSGNGTLKGKEERFGTVQDFLNDTFPRTL